MPLPNRLAHRVAYRGGINKSGDQAACGGGRPHLTYSSIVSFDRAERGSTRKHRVNWWPGYRRASTEVK
jgi:hypothetical protein